ncbi:MAG: hypothetical protein ABI634_19955 [Acidobacteriota bacterium]
MTTLQDRLRDADPIRFAPDQTDDRIVARQRVLAASRAEAAEIERPRLGRRHAALAVACLAVAGALVGSQIWPRGGTALQAAVQFEARLAESQPGGDLRGARITHTAESTYLHRDVIVSNGDVADARVVPGADADHFGVRVEFTPAGAQKMRDATSSHLGQPIAILIDGDVVAAPILRSPIDTTALISGNYTEAEAERIATGILKF